MEQICLNFRNFLFIYFFQIGRSSESPIDFVVMDTQPGDKKDTKVLQSTISRFACRLLVDRTESSKARIYAAGFDSSRNIFLGVSFFFLFLEQSFICLVWFNQYLIFFGFLNYILSCNTQFPTFTR